MTPDTFSSLINLGAAGAVIIVVVLFLRAIKERDEARIVSDEKRDAARILSDEKRDAEWRNFFTALNGSNRSDVCELAATMERMVKALDDHDKQAKIILEGVQKIDRELTKPVRGTRGKVE